MVDPIERIKEKIKEDVRWKISEFEEDAKRKIEKIRKEEMGRWEEEKKKIIAEGKRDAEGIRSMIISRANLEGKRILMEAREEIIKKVVDEIKKNARNVPSYGNYVMKSINEGKNVFGEKFRIVCDREDMELVKNIASRIVPQAEITEGEVPFGGIRIESVDSLEVMDFSVNSLVERRMNDIRKLIVEKLFEGEHA